MILYYCMSDMVLSYGCLTIISGKAHKRNF